MLGARSAAARVGSARLPVTSGSPRLIGMWNASLMAVSRSATTQLSMSRGPRVMRRGLCFSWSALRLRWARYGLYSGATGPRSKVVDKSRTPFSSCGLSLHSGACRYVVRGSWHGFCSTCCTLPGTASVLLFIRRHIVHTHRAPTFQMTCGRSQLQRV